jgi:hypothetical protein
MPGPEEEYRMSPLDLDRIALRVRKEFQEMPGLQISFSQMTRLCGLEPSTCRAVVDVLVGCAFLRWTAGDLLTRVDGQRYSHPSSPTG